MTAAAAFKPLSMVEGCLPSIPTQFSTKPSHPFLPIPHKTLRLLHLSFSSSSSPSSLPQFISTRKKLSLTPLVAQTSDWAQENELKSKDFVLECEEPEQQEGEVPEAGLSESEEEPTEEGGFVVNEGEPEGDDGYVEPYAEPPEEAKLFVGNLSYDVDSEKLARLFDEAGVVEVAEVIYNRETDQSRGFGFVTLSTVEEADKAVEMFNRYKLFLESALAAQLEAEVQQLLELETNLPCQSQLIPLFIQKPANVSLPGPSKIWITSWLEQAISQQSIEETKWNIPFR